MVTTDFIQLQRSRKNDQGIAGLQAQVVIIKENRKPNDKYISSNIGRVVVNNGSYTDSGKKSN